MMGSRHSASGLHDMLIAATWTLVLFLYAGVLSRGDSVALQTLPGFTTEATCQEAGRKSAPLIKGTIKDYKFVCLEVK